jgi:non-specific serine/threonine protein kinase
VRPDLPLTDDDIRAIDDICAQVDGLPLAIELAAARTRFLAPVALRDRLTQRLHLLVGGPRDAPERHQTLRATLTWSHDLLTSDERVLFRRLAVFESSAPLDAVEPVCNAARDLGGNVEDVLASLVDHSLVKIIDVPGAGPRVRLLNTIREFAQEQLALSREQEAVQSAHAAWFADHVIATPYATWRTGSAEHRQWTVRHLPDVENFSAALSRLMREDNHVAALRMVSWLVHFWVEIGELREGSKWTDTLMPYVDEAPVEAQSHFLRVAAIMALKDDEIDAAATYAGRSLALAEQVGDPRLVGNALNLLGQIRWREGDGAEGERLQRQAIATVQEASDSLGGALFAAQIADALIEAGELDRAEPLLREAMPVIARERPGALPFLQGAMGYLLLQRGDIDAAAGYLEQCLDYHIQPPHRMPSLLAGRLIGIADLGVRRGAFAEAARLLMASIALCQRIGIVIDQQSKQELHRIGDQVCAALGNDRLLAEAETGKRLTTTEVIDLALAVTRMRAGTAAPEPVDTMVPDNDLTPRERVVLALLAEGLSNPAIAEALFISERTVTTHLSRLYAKLDVSTRAEAIALAMRTGLVDAPAART